MKNLIRLICFASLLIPILCEAAPSLFFSDLTSGPSSGWFAALPNQGAAVTIWGENLGTAGSGVYLTACGQTIQSTGSGIAEWNTTGTANGVARGMGRITFWLNSGMSGSAGITVTTSEGTSNTLPFTIRSGNIFFIATTGNNGAAGSITAPWKDLDMSLHDNNSAVTAGATIYVRGGTYTTPDRTESGSFIAFRSTADAGTAANPIVLASYPGEVAIANLAGKGYGLSVGDTGCDTGQACGNYWTFSKIKMINGNVGINIRSHRMNVVGCWFSGITGGGWSGILDNDSGTYNNFYGNYFYQVGNAGPSDCAYTHTIYINGTAGPINHVNVRYNEFDHTVNCANYGGNIDIRAASYIDVSENYFHDCNDQPFYTSAEGGAVTNIYFYNNVASNAAIIPSAGDPASGEYCLHLNDLDSTSLVYNNTLYRCPINSNEAVLGVYGAFTGHSTVYSKNNIIYGSSASQPALYIESTGTFNSANDDYYTVTVPSGSGVTVTNDQTGDPLFVSNGSNFHLQATSPAKDHGTSAVSGLVTTDFDGISRPQGTAYDIGAYEYDTGGGGDTPPTAPTNLRIVSP